jgi:hypothetical protein
MNISLAQNISICIGRLALAGPKIVSKYLDKFLNTFCLSLTYIKDSPEKRDSFKGLCETISFNPKDVFNSFQQLCEAFCFYENPPDDLEKTFQKIIYSFSVSYKEKFYESVSGFSDNLKNKMEQKFKIKID